MDKPLLTGPAPQVQPMVASSGQTSALMTGLLNQRNAAALNELAGGFKGRSRRNKTKGRKLTRHRRNKRSTKLRSKKLSKKLSKKRSTKRSTKRSRLYKGGSNPIPYSAPSGSNAAVLNISEELALAHATANINAKLDSAATKAP
jgi:hypothetical protein